MDELGLAVAAIAVIVVLFLIYEHLENRKYPAGPCGVPLLGYLPFLGKLFHVSLANLSKKYGNIVSVRLGRQIVVVLNDYEAVREALVVQGETFSGRIQNRDKLLHTNKNGIVASEGPTWKEQKRYILRNLKNLGLGQSAFEREVMYEVDILTDYLKGVEGKPVEIMNLLLLPLMNITSKLLCGKRYERRNEEFKHLETTLINLRTSIPILNVFSLLNSFISKMFFEDAFNMGMKQLINYATDQVESHDKQLNEDDPQQNFVDMYLSEVRRNARINGSQIAPFMKANVIASVADMTFAGMETTETSLIWLLLHVAHNLEIQKKIQQELDNLMTNDSNLSPNSKSLAPFTQATFMEVQRYTSVTPLTVPHRTIRDTVLLGHRIPKNTMVFLNLYAVHHDERHWGDPHVFRPERFLDAEGQVIHDDHLIPFSAGPRVCLGEPMARTMLFLFFTCLLRRFTFSFVEGQPKPSMEIASAGITVRPHPFSLVVTCRQ